MNIEVLRDYCLNLAGATEAIKWGEDLCFCVGEKMFCVTSLESPQKVSFKVSDEQYGELITKQAIGPAPYLARYKWVQVEDWEALSDEDWIELIKNSYELIKAKLPKSKLKLI